MWHPGKLVAAGIGRDPDAAGKLNAVGRGGEGTLVDPQLQSVSTTERLAQRQA